MRDVSVEVRVKIDEEIMDVRVSRVFCSRNPRGVQYNVNLMLAGSNKGIRLYCKTEEDAKLLVQRIREGQITDLTDYPAKWNFCCAFINPTQ